MCGICGLVVPAGITLGEAHKHQVNLMIDALMHRGPDDTGIGGDTSAIFGMTRLAIRGLNDGKQPIVDPETGVMMACNGEIDNHQELRAWLLDQGRPVGQSTDVAVIPGLYLELGENFVERLKGAFAIAIWDPRENKLLLVRDRAGERPLFYAHIDGIVVFASLIAALVSPAPHIFDISPQNIHSYLMAGFFAAPETPFKTIQKVLPGEIVTITPAGVNRRRYWRWNAAQAIKKPGGLDSFDTLFRAAITRQSDVDVDFGLFLSGGLDSSLITAVTKAIRPDKALTAYSLRFTEASYDEGHYAEKVAHTLDVNFVPVWVKPEDFPPTIAKLVRQVGEPLSDPAWVPSALLARRAAEDVRVALVGEGADELFGGYPTYFGAELALTYAKFPKPIRGLVRRMVDSLPPSDKKVTLAFLLKRFTLGDDLDFLARHILWTSSISPAILERLGITPPLMLIPRYPSAKMLDRLQQYDLENSLAEGLLTKADRASMKSALELRAPFLDQRVMEFAAMLPDKQRVHHVTTKVFLKQYALRYLPKDIVHRKKRGLSVPLSSWLREPLYDWAQAKLVSPQLERIGIKSKASLQLLQEHQQRKADHARAIWTICVLSEWLDWVSEAETRRLHPEWHTASKPL
ncbi:MAG: asparagine synthase (glutamine-hydrolyzing) [Methylococcales bacterium]|nr:asparagine synthase (glutamine-hydrolyzing) [Methylococcales bacterium]